MSLIDFFDRGVEIDAHRPCLISGDDVLTYLEAQRSSYRIADALARAGIIPQSRIAVLGPNSNRSFECVLGVLRAGAIWVPVNARNALEETIFVLNHTEAQIIFYSVKFADQLPDIRARCPMIKRAVRIDGDPAAGEDHFDAFCSQASVERFETSIKATDLATLACSGGTTGLPKGVMTTHATWAYRIAEVMVRLAHPRPIHLVAAPMTHGAGASALEMMPMGATHIVLPRFDPGAILEAIARHKVTHMFMPPTALYLLMAHPSIRETDLSSLAYLICGGAPIAPQRLREASSLFGRALHIGYGGTEIGGGLCWMRGQDLIDAIDSSDDERLLSCGRASQLARVDIRGDDGAVLPIGEPGEIVVGGFTLASGYYGNSEETANAFRADGFHSGDIGYKDADGWVYISDRKKDMIISGGFNVYPSEIESVLLSHPAVQDCAVIGVPDDHWGEAVKAVIELKVGESVDQTEFDALCRANLAGFKVPKSIEIWTEIPRSPVGKVLKRVIRDRFWTGQGRRV